MQIEVTVRRPAHDGGQPDAQITLRLDALKWSRELLFRGCADPAVARAAGRAYGWYLGYLLYANAALIRAHATRSVVEHSRDGERSFMEICLDDGAGARAETVKIAVKLGEDGNPAEDAGAILREQGLRILQTFADAPSQAMALLGDRPFYLLPSWMDGALQAARRLELSAPGSPAARGQQGEVPGSDELVAALRAS